MQRKTLSKILEFRGDIPTAYEFIVSIYNDLRFKIPFSLDGSVSPRDSFAYTIRNYRKFKLIHPINKQGRKLWLDGRNLIQFFLVQRFLWDGYTLKSLQGIRDLHEDELKRLILAKSVVITDLPASALPMPSTSASNLAKNAKWYHIKVTNGIVLQIQSDKFSPEKINAIRDAVKSAIDEIV